MQNKNNTFQGILSKKYWLLLFFCTTLILFPFYKLNAQNKNKPQLPLTRILFVFDCSYSMYGQWQSGMKMDLSKKLLGEFLDSIRGTENLELAFRAYGHQVSLRPQRSCTDTKLEVAFAKDNILAIKTLNFMGPFINKVLQKNINTKGSEICLGTTSDSSGNAYVIYSIDANNTNMDIILQKFDIYGNIIWTKQSQIKCNILETIQLVNINIITDNQNNILFTYCTNNEVNGFIYILDKDGDVGDKIGYFKDSEPIFYNEEN